MKRVHVVLEDDKDGGPADQTVAFALDGSDYEIDLADRNAKELRTILQPWVESARKVGSSRLRVRIASRTPQTPNRRSDNRTIRAWAQQKGIAIAGRGRIPEDVRQMWTRENAAGQV